MQETFAAIQDAIKQHSPDESEAELNQAAGNLLGFFELLLQIDREQKERRNENIRSEYPIHQAR